jgi:hypothetical protein
MIQLEAEERVLLKVRKHKFILIIQALPMIILVIGLPIVYTYIAKLGYFASFAGNTVYLFIFSYATIFLLSWIAFFVFWTDYYLDTLIVTNKRLLDIEQRGFFNREISILRLDKIQDITVTIKGVLATFIDFGSLHIQTAGEQREFVVRDIPNPNKVRKIIYDLHNKILENPQSVKIINNE